MTARKTLNIPGTPRLILLPGMDGSGRLFEPFIAALGPGYPVTTVAYPPERPLGYAELMRLVRGWLPADEPFVLLAESFSGPVAIMLAAENPAGLRGLVLVSTFARAPVPRIFGGLLRLPFWRAGAALASRVLLGPRAPAAIRAALAEAMRSVKPAVWRARAQAIRTADAIAALAGLRLPVLHLSGRGDRLLGNRAARSIATMCPGVTWRELDGPHLLLQARPSECAEVIRLEISGKCRACVKARELKIRN